VTTAYAPHTVDLRAYYEQDRHYSLEDLERLLPPLPDSTNDDNSPRRTYEGPFNPHQGKPLSAEVQEKLARQIQEWELRRHYDGRYAGPCPFPHDHGPSDVQAFYVSPITGFWYCFRSSHQGQRYGGVGALIPGIDDQRWVNGPDAAAEPYYMEGSDGPRRRFPLHTDRAAIRNIRHRLNVIWMETYQVQGTRESLTVRAPADTCQRETAPTVALGSPRAPITVTTAGRGCTRFVWVLKCASHYGRRNRLLRQRGN
jgi:hypothetical protein